MLQPSSHQTNSSGPISSYTDLALSCTLLGVKAGKNILGQYGDLQLVAAKQDSVVLFLMDVRFISSLIPVDCCPDCDNLVFI